MADLLETRFVIAPITTALQKLGRPEVRAWVLATVRDDEPVQFGELRKALADWPNRDQGDVVFEIQVVMTPEQALEYVDADEFPKCVLFSQFELVQLAFEAIAREAGFRRASATVSLDNKPHDWKLIAADFKNNSEQDARAEESPIGDDLLEVYPVRTALSRYDNFDADYVFRIVPPLNECEPATAARIPEAIRARASKIKRKKRHGITFLSTATEWDSQARDVDNQLRDQLLDKEFWNEQLGFERAATRSPQGAFLVP
jgi:hypothetical protein